MAGVKGRSGRKRKPLHLHLIQGTFRRDRHGPPEPPQPPRGTDNGLQPPKKLGKRQQRLWDQHIRTLPGLLPVDAPTAFIWVQLQAEWEKNPEGMKASRMALVRRIGRDLGMGGGK